MSQPVKQRLEKIAKDGAAASRVLANYMLANMSELPFATAGDIAATLRVSESTVGRFCRALGYKHFKDMKGDLKADLGNSPWLIGERLQAFQARGSETSSQGLELEMAALVRVHEHTRSAQWPVVCERLARMPRVYAAGFQTERGIAQSFVHLLQYLRDGVHLVDGAAGYFGEVLLAPPDKTALVVFEARRYSLHALKLCRHARQAGIAVTLITDNYCDWADENATEVFRVPTAMNLFWESTAPMLSLVHLLLNDVFKQIGPGVEQRLESVRSLHEDFVGFSSSTQSRK